jgi:nucleoside-diphosphate-sugar epimerase
VHAVGEEGIESRAIAAAIGAFLGVPAVSVATELVDGHFGWIGRYFGMDITASNARTRELLGWTPTGPTLLEDIAAGAYALT